jgi:hypothetical protein
VILTRAELRGKKSYCVLLIVFIFTCNFWAQVESISPNQSLIFLNPSFAGSSGGLRLQSQLESYSLEEVNSGTSVDYYISKIKGAPAFIFQDSYGSNYWSNTLSNQTRLVGISYAQHLSPIENLKIIPSAQLIYSQSISANEWTFSPQTNTTNYFLWSPFSQTSSQMKSDLTISAAVLFKIHKNLYFGSSVYGLRKKEPGYTTAPIWLVHWAYDAKIKEKAMLQFFAKAIMGNGRAYGTVSVNALLSKHVLLSAGYKSFYGPFFGGGYRVGGFNVLATCERHFASARNTYNISFSYLFKKSSSFVGVPNFEEM